MQSELTKDPQQAEMLKRATSGSVEAGTVDGGEPHTPDAESRYPGLALYTAIANSNENIDPAIKAQAAAAAKAITDAQLAHAYNPANEGDSDRYAKGDTFVGPLVKAPRPAHVPANG